MPGLQNRRTPDSRPRLVSRVDIAFLAAGLVGATVAGVFAYDKVGPYGDGPINVGLYRTVDPDSGVLTVYREVRTAEGTILRYHFDDGSRALNAVHSIGADGRTVVRPVESGASKTGFSLLDDGIVDAWEYRDARGRLEKVEVSRKRDGRVDRWEYYRNDQLARVEEDEDRDGRVDRWQTYDGGILVGEVRDADGDGRPDGHRP